VRMADSQLTGRTWRRQIGVRRRRCSHEMRRELLEVGVALPESQFCSCVNDARTASFLEARWLWRCNCGCCFALSSSINQELRRRCLNNVWYTANSGDIVISIFFYHFYVPKPSIHALIDCLEAIESTTGGREGCAFPPMAVLEPDLRTP